MATEVPLLPKHHRWSLPADYQSQPDTEPSSWTGHNPVTTTTSTTTATDDLTDDFTIPDLPLFLEARSHALVDPQKAAIIDKTRDQSFTYSELLNDVAVLRCQIQQYIYSNLGSTQPATEEEPRVAFLAPSGYDYVRVQWAIWAAGGVCVPLCRASPILMEF